MKFFNYKKKILFPSSFKGKIIKYDPKIKSIITDSSPDPLKENFQNKTVLVIFPYPCKHVK